MANSAISAPGSQAATTNTSVQQQQMQSAYLLPKLHTLFTKTLSTTLAKCSYPAFAACFPTPAAKKPETLKAVWKQIVDKMESKALSEFDSILQEKELDRRFAELEVVLKKAKENMEVNGKGKQVDGEAGVAFHSLSPSDLFLATLAPRLGPLVKQLEQTIIQQQQANDNLIKELLQRRTEIEDTVKKLEDVVSDVQGANEVLYRASQDMADIEQD